MSHSPIQTSLVRFGIYEADLRTGELRKQGRRVRLQEMPFQVLAALLERPGDLVTREEIRKRLWPDGTFVDFDNGINTAVNRLREALSDTADNPRFVETIPRRGYRFIAPIQRVPPASPDTPEPESSGARPAGLSSWLKGLAGALVIAAMVGVAYIGLYPVDGSDGTDRIMLAVLPFESLNQDGDYLSDGLTDETITHLGRLAPDRLGVIARTSAMRYRSSSKTLPEIAEELDVDYLLEGMVRREEGRIRITVKLIEAAHQTQLWGESFDRNLGGVLDLQREIADNVARSLAIELLPETAGKAPSQPPNPAAYEAYLKGRYHWNKQTDEAVKKSIRFFKEAIEKDPSFALAHTGLALAYLTLAGFGNAPSEETYTLARASAMRALEVDDSIAEAHAALASISLFYDRDWQAARAGFARALAQDSGATAVRLWHGCSLVAHNRSADAIAEIERAVEVDPLSFMAHATVGWYYLFARQYEEAIARCRKTLDLEPTYYQAGFCLQLAYFKTGRFAEALAEGQRWMKSFGASVEKVDQLGKLEPREGFYRLWALQLKGLTKMAEKSPVSPYTFALHHAVLGQNEKALDWLERAYEEHSSMVIYLRIDPTWDDLRSQARFQNLLSRLNLPE